MRILKIFKYLLILLFLLLALIIAAGYWVTQSLDPNELKPQIQDAVKNASDLTLKMNGDLSWEFFPSVKLALKDSELHTAKAYGGDTLFAKLDSIDVGLAWKGLLAKKINATHLIANDLTLRLVTEKNGHSNWKDIEADSTNNAEAQISTEASVQPLQFSLKKLELNKVAVTINDLAANVSQEIYLPKTTGTNLNINGDTFPFNTDVKLTSKSQENENSITIKLFSNLLLDLANQKYEFRDINGKFDNSKFKGNAALKLGKVTQVVTELSIDQINLDNYLNDTSNTNKPANDTPHANQNANTDTELPLDFLHTLNTNTSLSIKKLIANNADLNNVTLNASINDGKLNIKNLSAEAFDGTANISIFVDANKKPAIFKIDQDLKGIQIAKLLESQKIEANLEGLASIKSNLSTRGNTVNQLKQFDGATVINFNEGRYNDDNIEKRICQAVALARNEKLVSQWETYTTFKNINSIINWRRGTGTISQFNAGLENATLTGAGTLSIPNSSIDLRMDANISGDLTGKDPGCQINERYSDIAWPLRCKGTADNISCGVDNDKVREIVKDKIEEKAKNKLEEKINEKLGEKASDLLKGLFK